jgi:hypothetical protein
MNPRIPAENGGSQIFDEEDSGFPDPIRKTQLAENSAKFICFSNGTVISRQYNFDI